MVSYLCVRVNVTKRRCRHFSQFIHKTLRLDKRGDDGLVVHDVVGCERAALAVLEPLLRGLVAADVEVPCRFRNIVEILRGIDVDATVLIFNAEAQRRRVCVGIRRGSM